jgi:sterol-4alpha-carboxylate 3-dehydrogenase (decarboxylating)
MPLDSQKLGPVVVTGGNGFVAYHIIAKILEEEKECSIHSMDIDTSRNRHEGVNYHVCDISSAEAVNRVMDIAKPKTVFHTASPEFSHLPDSMYRSILVDGTRHLLAAAKRLGTVQAFVYTNSSSVIHDNISDLVDATEEFPVLKYPQQKRIYSLCKAEAEEDILAANRSDGNKTLLSSSLRPCLAFGEHDTGSLGKMLGNIFEGRARYQMGDGNNLFDFMYVGNLADAHLLIARALIQAWGKPVPSPETRVDGEAFNVTNEDPWPFWDFQRALARAVGKPVKPEEIVVIPRTVGIVLGTLSEWLTWIASRGARTPNMTVEGIRFSTITRTFKIDKIKQRLGYRPQVSMQEAIERGVKWYLEEARASSLEREHWGSSNDNNNNK